MKQFTATANDEGVRLSRFVQSVTRDLPTSLLYKSFRNMRLVRARCIKITSPVNEPTDVDGQPGADFPLHIECLPGELRVLCQP